MRPELARRELRADCSRCEGLCCGAPAFAGSADFAIDKPAGRPCPNLGPEFGCRIHQTLRDRGFRAAPPSTASAPGSRLSR